MHRLRVLWLITKRSGVGKSLIAFMVVYLICAAIVQFSEPNINNYGDALWFLWAVSLTVGLGDYTAVTALGRFAVVVCSLFAVVVVAIVTGVVVDYFNEVRQHQLDSSITVFLDKLERLPELSKEELEEVSHKVKKLRR